MDSRAFSDSSTSYPRVILIFLFNFIIYLSNFEAYLNDERLQTAVSQIEHGVLHLVDTENPQITILLDCEGLSPLRFPMQIMRSCSSLLQDHFPNRLGCLFVIRLPPVVRVVAQTFIQVNFLLIWIWITFRFFFFFIGIMDLQPYVFFVWKLGSFFYIWTWIGGSFSGSETHYPTEVKIRGGDVPEGSFWAPSNTPIISWW